MENKIPDISNLATKILVNEVENRIRDISNLATKILVNEVGNRIPDIGNLATKTALTTVQNKISDISSLVKEIDYNMKIADIELRVNKLQAYDLIVDIYIVYELAASSSHTSDCTIKNCLFGAVTLTKTVDFEKYKYSGYGIGFDRRSSFSFPSGGFGQNVLIFGVDMSSSPHIDNKKKDILVLGRGTTQGLESTQTAEKMYSINFTVTKRNFV